MKKIYKFTLDDEVPLSNKTNSDLREIAFWLYDEFTKFDEPIVLVDDYSDKTKDGLVRNDLYDVKLYDDYVYHFTSDFDEKHKMMYEPFMLDNKSFGFTVYDGAITDEQVEKMLNYTLNILKLKYQFKIDSEEFDDKNKKGRLVAIKNLINREKEAEVSAKRRVKSPLSTLATMMFMH